MNIYPHLPDSEFIIMQIIWSNNTPISKTTVAELASEHGWKPQTVHSFLNRLEKRGFLSSEKQGKERVYEPIVCREAYLNQETERFISTVHQNSLKGFMTALFSNKVSKEDLSEIKQWLDENSSEGE